MASSSDHKPQPMEYRKMEQLIHRMQDKQRGVEVKTQKKSFTSIPDVVTGEDVISWLRVNVTREEEAEEAAHLANLLCYHGYIFPVTDTKTLTVKMDSTPYRFQNRRFWLSGTAATDFEAYAIYLEKRSLRNKQKHGLEEHEQLALDNIQKRSPDHKLVAIRGKAEEELKDIKKKEKNEKAIFDSQERAFWKTHRPPPGQTKRCEEGLKHYFQPKQVRERFAKKEFLAMKVRILKRSRALRSVKMSQVLETYLWRADNYRESDPFLCPVYPSNPWIAEDDSLWSYHADCTAPPTAQCIRKWELSFWDLLTDPRGRAEFQTFLEKEYSQENLSFWTACEDVKFASIKQLPNAIQTIMEEYISKGSPQEVNIDSRTRLQVQSRVEEGRASRPSRFTFLDAQDQIFRLMMKDTYVRFLRSDQFQQLKKIALPQEDKKGFFSRGFTPKKGVLNPSPKPKVRGTCSLGDEESEGGSLSSSEPRHARSIGSLLDLEEKSAVSMRSGKTGTDSSLRKCDTSPSLSGRHERASFTKGGSFNRKQQQQQQQQLGMDSTKHRSMNLDNTATSGVKPGLPASKTTT